MLVVLTVLPGPCPPFPKTLFWDNFTIKVRLLGCQYHSKVALKTLPHPPMHAAPELHTQQGPSMQAGHLIS